MTLLIRSNARRAHLGRWRRARGVSEIVGTMLILGVTLVLVAAIFAFVLRSPSPSVAPASEFSVALQRNATALTNVSITYTVGPPLASSTTNFAKVILASTAVPMAFGAPFSVAAGHVSPSASWNPGEVWWLSLASYHLPAADNLTVRVIANERLVYSTIAPGPPVRIAPYFLSIWTTPSNLVHGAVYTLYATIAIPDGLGAGSVTANLSLAGGPATPQAMSPGNTSGVAYWSYSPSTFPSSAGTYTAYIVVTDSLGARNVDVVPLTFS